MENENQDKKIERIKYYIIVIIVALIGIAIGIDQTYAQTFENGDFIIWNTNWQQQANCTNKTVCTAYPTTQNGSLDVRHFGSIFKYGFDAEQSYTFKVKLLYSVTTKANSFGGLDYMGPPDIQLRKDNVTTEKPVCTSGETNNVVKEQYYHAGTNNGYWYFEVESNITCTFKTTKIANSINVYQTFRNVTYDQGDIQLISGSIDAVTTNQDVVDSIDNATQDIINNQNANQQQTNERLDSIISGQQYEKPEKNKQIADLEEQEESIFDLFEFDPDSVTIDIDDTSTNKIFELLSRIITQNTLIQTMVITILSISIIKLVLGR